MKYAFLIPLVATLAMANSHAQARIYRCGNEYHNDTTKGQAKGCKLVEGGNVTIVQNGPPGGGNAPVRVASTSSNNGSAPAGAPRIDTNEQRARDSDSKAILESELKKAEARQAELAKEFNGGEPDKLGPETRNHQKYLDRVAELKANLARNESDIAGLKRELGRMGGSK